MNYRPLPFLAVFAAALASACSGTPADPLLGSWSSSDPTNHMVPSGATSFTDVVTFTGEETFTFVQTWSFPATATTMAGCTSTTTSAGSFVVSGSSLNIMQSSLQIVVTGCMNSIQNTTTTPVGGGSSNYAVTFSISGSTLSINESGGVTLTYTKR